MSIIDLVGTQVSSRSVCLSMLENSYRIHDSTSVDVLRKKIRLMTESSDVPHYPVSTGQNCPCDVCMQHCWHIHKFKFLTSEEDGLFSVTFLLCPSNPTAYFILLNIKSNTYEKKAELRRKRNQNYHSITPVTGIDFCNKKGKSESITPTLTHN